jgi:PD-(D/E)XK nuclease superfamily
MPRLGGNGRLWLAVPPKKWPLPPRELSVSSLHEIESCPRRWALTTADYPELWDQHGYPPRLAISALAGSVVHLTLRTITNALAQADCESVESADAVKVIRDLGGFSNLIDQSVQRILSRFRTNPRAESLLDPALRSLRARIPEMRADVQSFLARIKLYRGAVASDYSLARKDVPRTSLVPGTYPEIELRAPTIGWHGIADLLILSDTSCEIVDFKTGVKDEAHRAQLITYALLWSRDSELNPAARPANRLTLSYRSGEMRLDPPTNTELDALEHELVKRSQSALAALSASPPQARPSADNCRFCNVRHLCDDYWKSATISALAEPTPDTSFKDLQITIVARHGPNSWDGIVEKVIKGHANKRVVLRTTGDSGLEFVKDDCIRVLNAHVSTDVGDSAQPMVATMGTMSEVFLLRSGNRQSGHTQGAS